MHSRVPGDVDVRPEFAPGHEWLREDYQAGFGEPRAIEGEFCDIVDGVVVATEWHTEDDPYSTGDLYTSVSTVGTDVETGKELWRTEGVACWGLKLSSRRAGNTTYVYRPEFAADHRNWNPVDLVAELGKLDSADGKYHRIVDTRQVPELSGNRTSHFNVVQVRDDLDVVISEGQLAAYADEQQVWSAQVPSSKLLPSCEVIAERLACGYLDDWYMVLDAQTGKEIVPRTELKDGEFRWAADGYVVWEWSAYDELHAFDWNGEPIDLAPDADTPYLGSDVRLPLDNFREPLADTAAIDDNGDVVAAYVPRDTGGGRDLWLYPSEQPAPEGFDFVEALSASGEVLLSSDSEAETLKVYSRDGELIDESEKADSPGLGVVFDGYIVYAHPYPNDRTAILLPPAQKG